jgi:hypothetical protein
MKTDDVSAIRMAKQHPGPQDGPFDIPVVGWSDG